MQIRRRTFNWSLRSILVLFLLTSLVLTILILLISSSVYRGVMRRNTGYTIELYASEQEKLMEDQLQTIKTALYALTNKVEIVHYLAGNRGYRASNVTYVTSLLSDIPRFVPLISDVVLATPDQHIVASSFNNTDIVNFMRRYDMLTRYYEAGTNSLASFSLVPTQGTEYILAMVVPVQSSTAIGVAVAFSTLDDLLGDANVMEHPCAIVADGRLLYSNAAELSDPDALLAYSQSEERWEGGHLIHLSLEAVGWDVFFDYPLNAVDDTLESGMTRWSILSVLIFAVIEGVLILSIYKIIVAPIMSISNQSTHITSTSRMLDNPVNARNELNLLVQNINDMIVRTNQLTGEVKDAKLRIMQMDITRLREHNMFLQAQINPHFLYNMLECICGMAAKENNDSIRDMTHLLARLYQYSLRSPDSTLGEELECVGMYEKIIRLRYDAGYSIRVDVAEDLLPLPMPRMSLEPIVENSVQHGFERGAARHFFVRISAAFSDDALQILISDNGCGIAPDRIKAINQDLRSPALERVENSDHIGLHNVNARLMLSYEPDSGLALAANREGGLDVTMRIHYPAVDTDGADT